MITNMFLGLSIAGSVAMVIWASTHVPPEPPPPLVATPESGQAFAPFVFIDSATGCEYLSTHLSSALTPRFAVDGKTHKGCATAAPEEKGKP